MENYAVRHHIWFNDGVNLLDWMALPLIIKMRQPLDGKKFIHKRFVVKAVRMDEDFMFETKLGWVQGNKGQWLVDLGDDLRVHLDHEAFERAYKPVDSDG